MLTMHSEVNTASPRFEIFAVMTEWLRLLSCLLLGCQYVKPSQNLRCFFFFFPFYVSVKVLPVAAKWCLCMEPSARIFLGLRG